MKRLRLKTLWKAVTVGQAAGPIVDMSGQSRPHQGHTEAGLNVVTSLPAPSQGRLDSGGVSDGEKTGATLLFSGIFLGLVGMTLTAMGWVNYDQSHALEWTQLLGPVLLSVGATFVLISVCKFHMLSCVSGGRGGGTGAEEGEMAHGQSFVFAGINQPITFHRATVVQYIPPPNASVTQGTSVLSGQPQLPSASGPPQYHSVFPLERPDMGTSGTLGPSVSSGRQESRDPEQRSEEEEDRKSDEDALDCLSPPAYEDLYPSPPSAVDT